MNSIIKENMEKLQPFVDDLVAYTKKKGIEFSPTDGELQNVVFKNKDKEVKISYYFFYRYSGISAIHRDKGAEVETVKMTDDMFMNEYVKAIINFHFKINI